MMLEKSNIPKVFIKHVFFSYLLSKYLVIIARDTEETWSQSETFLWSLTEIVILWGGFSYV